MSGGWAMTLIFIAFPFDKFTCDNFDMFYAVHKEDSLKNIHGFKNFPGFCNVYYYE